MAVILLVGRLVPDGVVTVCDVCPLLGTDARYLM
jgi:hypothetical protein